jgi:hypothetical protein
MQGRALSYPGSAWYRHEQNYPAGSVPPPETIVYYTGVERKIDVVPGPIVRGNRKNPNAWYYDIAVRQAGTKTGFSLQTKLATGEWSKNTFGGRYKTVQTGLATKHADLVARADTDSYSKLIEGLRGKLDVSVDLAQAGKTATIGSAVRKTVIELGRAIVSIKRKPFDATVQIGKLAGEMRLIWVYGIKPTAQTLYDAVEESYNRMSREGVWIKGRASSSAIYTSSGTGWPDPAWKWTAEVNDNAGCEYAIKVVIPRDSEPVAARWSSLNPVSITWELLPFSFVADWFLSVGEYIRNLESAIVYFRYFQTGYRSTRYCITYKQRGQDVSDTTSGGFRTIYQLYSEGAESLDRGMRREVLLYFPLPPPIRWNPELGSARLLNAAALLSTFINRQDHNPRGIRGLGKNVPVPKFWK